MNYEIEEFDYPSFIEGRAGKILINKKEVGIIGEIHPDVLNNFEIEMPSSALEINIDEVFEEIQF